MPRSRSNSIQLLIAVCGIFLCSTPATPSSEPGWLEINSAHFRVITDAGEKKGREVALRFEQMRSVFAGLLTKERLNQSVTLTILAFKNDKSYYQVAPLVHLEVPGQPSSLQPIGVPGFFLAGEDQDFIV